MIRMSVQEIADAVRGRVLGDAGAMVSGTVRTDSRAIEPGDIFVALPGETTDGHRFI